MGFLCLLWKLNLIKILKGPKLRTHLQNMKCLNTSKRYEFIGDYQHTSEIYTNICSPENNPTRTKISSGLYPLRAKNKNGVCDQKKSWNGIESRNTMSY